MLICIYNIHDIELYNVDPFCILYTYIYIYAYIVRVEYECLCICPYVCLSVVVCCLRMHA